VIRELSCSAAELSMYFVVNLAEQVQCFLASDGTEPYSDGNDSDNEFEQRISPDEKFVDCPESGYIFYNTQVVFDRDGRVIASYRKKHLFLEPHFRPGEQPDEDAIFNTDFGVTFTLQICFDIMYESPGKYNIDHLGIRDVAMSTAWIDELPHLTAPQVWKGWSDGNRVNLIVANYHNPAKGELGSGIFRGLTSNPETYLYDVEAGTSLIVGKVKSRSSVKRENRKIDEETRAKKIQNTQNEGQNRKLENTLAENLEKNINNNNIHNNNNNNQKRNLGARAKIGENQAFYHEDLSLYNSSSLDKTDTEQVLIKTVCSDDGFCCDLTYSYLLNQSEMGLYKLFAYSGLVEKGDGVYSMYTQTCSVVYCLSDEVNSCARIEGREPEHSTLRVFEVRGTFASGDIYPSVFTQYLKLEDSSNWNFTLAQYPEYYHASMFMHEKTENLLAITMFSRWYARDPFQNFK
ncbi:hypothetical protein SK128_007973, partial [Halocaridina rubra]